MINIKNRIKEFLNTKRISKLKFYKTINVANGYLDKDGAVNSHILGIILSKYPDININWLLFGKEKMFVNVDENLVSSNTSCNEKCVLKDYIINLQKEKIKIMETQILEIS